MKVIVRGDHPIFKRVDEIFDDPERAKERVGELIHYGYDNVYVEPFVGKLGEKQKKTLAGPDRRMIVTRSMRKQKG